MLIRVFSAGVIFVGLVVMARAVARYHKLYLRTREETYDSQHFSMAAGKAALVLMYFFLAGYVVGLLHVMLTEIEPIFGFVALVFFLGGIYIYMAINAQINMYAAQREKSMEVMRTFVNAIDMKDAYTKGHSRQVYNIVALIYDHLEPARRAGINRAKLLDAAILHDIGKISIQDDVLSKSGPLAPREWDQIKMHPANGKRMLDDTVFRDISNWVLYHHERMDGSGYYNLPADSIPVEARIIAVADTYGALCTDRTYRPRRSHETAMAIMAAAAGEQLDAELMAIFQTIELGKLEAALADV